VAACSVVAATRLHRVSCRRVDALQGVAADDHLVGVGAGAPREAVVVDAATTAVVAPTSVSSHFATANRPASTTVRRRSSTR